MNLRWTQRRARVNRTLGVRSRSRASRYCSSASPAATVSLTTALDIRPCRLKNTRAQTTGAAADTQWALTRTLATSIRHTRANLLAQTGTPRQASRRDHEIAKACPARTIQMHAPRRSPISDVLACPLTASGSQAHWPRPHAAPPRITPRDGTPAASPALRPRAVGRRPRGVRGRAPGCGRQRARGHAGACRDPAGAISCGPEMATL